MAVFNSVCFCVWQKRVGSNVMENIKEGLVLFLLLALAPKLLQELQWLFSQKMLCVTLVYGGCTGLIKTYLFSSKNSTTPVFELYLVLQLSSSTLMWMRLSCNTTQNLCTDAALFFFVF